MPFFSLSPQGRGNRPMPFFFHCPGPHFSLYHWGEGTVRCRFYSLLRSASLTLPLERGNHSMPFLFTALARFSHSPTGEREPFDVVFIHCSGPLFSLSHGREGTVRYRFYSLLRPAFLTLPRERGNRSMPFLFIAPARFSPSPLGRGSG